jgi:hypothetical protein
MSIGLDDLTVRADHCPFPSCQALLDKSTPLNGGRLCSSCGRWSTMTSLESLSIAASIGPRRPQISTDQKYTYRTGRLVYEEEDIEVYRHIHIQLPAFPERPMPIINVISTFPSTYDSH